MHPMDTLLILASLILIACTLETADGLRAEEPKTAAELVRNIRAGIYAEPVCEICGRPLDGASHVCR